MLIEPPAAVSVVIVSVLLVCALLAVLVITALNATAARGVPLLVAAGLAVLCVILVAVVPVNVPVFVGVPLAVIGTAAAVVGGNPVARRVLSYATHGTVREGIAGGILVELGSDPAGARMQEVLRGGTTIGYLERVAVVLSIIAGYPETIAVVVAVKGVGRFSELATPAARERFIVGTLASLVWAGVLGAAVRLALW